MVAILDLLRRCFAQQTSRLEDHHDHEHPEDDRRGPLRAPATDMNAFMNPSLIDQTSPMMNPPSTAPFRLPMPPSTAAVKANSP